MRIDAIKIGNRARKDMGDLQGLADSIKRHGLLHPVVVTSNKMLVAGHRRIEAVRMNGAAEIAVTVVDVDDLLSAERDENTERKDFAPTEAVAIGALIEEQERPKAAESKKLGARRSALVRTGHDAGKRTEPYIDTRETAARAVGMSSSTYGRAKSIVAAAESDPAKFGDLPEKMDDSGNVSGVHRELQRRQGVKSKKHRHPIFKNTPYPKPNRTVERTTWALTGLCDALETVDAAELDASKVDAWIESLKGGVSRINQSIRRFKNV